METFPGHYVSGDANYWRKIWSVELLQKFNEVGKLFKGNRIINILLKLPIYKEKTEIKVIQSDLLISIKHTRSYCNFQISNFILRNREVENICISFVWY